MIGADMQHVALQLSLFGLATAALSMLVLWVFQLRSSNAGVVDVGWAYNLGLLALLYALLGPGPTLPRWTITAMVALWSGRLGTHLFRRVVGKPEEGRYRQLRQQWSSNTAAKFLLFFEAQALLDVLLSIPFLLVAADANAPAGLAATQIAGVAVWGIAVLGESIADAQLARFKRRSTQNEVCRAGLWNYSRHPNYFFEWLVWVGWALFAQPAHLGWLAWSAPLLILFFLLRITGIPATEEQSLRTKGEAYAEYQRTTSPFIPWFHKRSGGTIA
jgi:steroid 5-alpha reductase family enzyme